MYGPVFEVDNISFDTFMLCHIEPSSGQYYLDMHSYLSNLIEHGYHHRLVMCLRKKTMMEPAVIGSNPIMTIHSEWRLLWVARDVWDEHRAFIRQDLQRESLWDVNSVTVERAASALR